MFRIFAALRVMFAVEREFKVLGSVVLDAIEKVIIPELQGMAAKEENPDMKMKYEALIGDYREYAKSDEFEQIAKKTILTQAKKYQMGGQDIADAAQNIASNFYTKPTWMASFESPRFDPRKGPVALKHHWATIATQQAMAEFREIYRKRARQAPVPLNDEGESMGDSYSNLPSPSIETEEDEKRKQELLNEMYYEMKEYVENNAHRYGFLEKLIVRVMQRWLVMVQKKTNVDFQSDIVIPVTKNLESRGLEAPSRSAFYEAKKAFMELVDKYLKSRGIRMTDVVRDRLHFSSEERITADMFKAKLARWVLSI